MGVRKIGRGGLPTDKLCLKLRVETPGLNPPAPLAFGEALRAWLLSCCPPAVYTFSKGLGFSESEFYQNYSSFGAVEADFWVQVFERTRGKTTMDLAWERLRFRERVLLSAFTLTQNLLAERSFALFTLKRNRASEQAQGIWRRFHDAFQSFFEPLVSGAIESGELMNRRLLRESVRRRDLGPDALCAALLGTGLERWI